MKLGPNGVEAARAAARIALASTELPSGIKPDVQELYDRAGDVLENWVYDQKTETWAIKGQGALPDTAHGALAEYQALGERFQRLPAWAATLMARLAGELAHALRR